MSMAQSWISLADVFNLVTEIGKIRTFFSNLSMNPSNKGHEDNRLHTIDTQWSIIIDLNDPDGARFTSDDYICHSGLYFSISAKRLLFLSLVEQ